MADTQTQNTQTVPVQNGQGAPVSNSQVAAPVASAVIPVADQPVSESKAVFNENKAADGDVPEWLKVADTAVSGKIANTDSFNLREEKPTLAEIGEDPSSLVPVSTKKVPDIEIVKKTEEDASQKLANAGYDPLTGKKVEEKSAVTGEQVVADKKVVDEAKVKATEVAAVQNKNSVLSRLKSLFSFSAKKPEQSVGNKDASKVPDLNLKKEIKTVVIDKVTGKEVKLTEAERKEYIEAEKIYQEGLASIKDLIAPSSMEIQYDSIRVDGVYAVSFYVYSYPRYLDVNWLSPIINFDVTMDISQFIYPINSDQIMRTLKKKVAQMQSSMRINSEKGMVRDPALETALEDAEQLRTEIQRGQEKFFQFALYFTIYSDKKKKLERTAKQLESLLGGKLVMTKRAQIQAEHGFTASIPLAMDELYVIRNMNTSPLSTTFPFSSSSLTSDKGILYGLNRHNDSLIIFDRFALENANSVVFAKSGAGKSYAVKLEILRLMMMGTDVIVIDPENEYEALANTVGGAYLKLSLNSDRRINPFDLPKPIKGDDVQPGDLLRTNIISLHGLLNVMLGKLDAAEESILDKALIDVYALKGITMDVLDPSIYEPPTMEDLYQILNSMEGAQGLSQKLSKYTVGSYSGIFNKPTNVNLSSGLMIFCIRDLEDALRPIAMYIILNYIWAKVRSELKKRILVVDEAWTMMQHEDSAQFLFGLVKRARKYYLGVTTITQDVEDFINSSRGKPIITNSSLQLLLKQSPSAVEVLAKIFNLTEGEKYVLLNSGVGQGLFFAGLKHVAIQVIASYTENKIVTTNPEEVLAATAKAEA
ncbi:MAG: DUF87 domain-containing protein [Candidatus Gracilibacteria bacterium]